MLGLSRPVYQPSGGLPVSRVIASTAARHVRALDVFVGLLIRDPAPAVTGDLVAVAEDRLDDAGIALQRHADAEHRQRHAPFAQQRRTRQTPARDHIRRAIPCSCGAAQRAAPRRFRTGTSRTPGRRAAPILGAFLVVHTNCSAIRAPPGQRACGGVLAVTGEVAGIGGGIGGGHLGGAAWDGPRPILLQSCQILFTQSTGLCLQ